MVSEVEAAGVFALPLCKTENQCNSADLRTIASMYNPANKL